MRKLHTKIEVGGHRDISCFLRCYGCIHYRAGGYCNNEQEALLGWFVSRTQVPTNRQRKAFHELGNGELSRGGNLDTQFFQRRSLPVRSMYFVAYLGLWLIKHFLQSSPKHLCNTPPPTKQPPSAAPQLRNLHHHHHPPRRRSSQAWRPGRSTGLGSPTHSAPRRPALRPSYDCSSNRRVFNAPPASSNP